jgi:class 3 adenylate cyclase
MGKVHSFQREDGRLPPRLVAALDREHQDALDHPVRREVLRTLHRPGRRWSGIEIWAELQPFQLSQVSYHLHVLRRSGLVVSNPLGTDSAQAHYVSKVVGDGKVRAVLRETEKEDKDRTAAAAEAHASPLLTMFRVPRPVRTIRLRSRSRIDAEQER